MQSASSGRRTVRFDTFELDVQAGELRRQGVRVRLQDQPLQILEMLLEHPGELVTREKLREQLWPSNSFVDFDHGLNRAINKLREALGDSAETPRYIETLARRGYRFRGELHREQEPIRALLVMPLDNLSGDPDQEYFAAGLSEALTTSLAKIGALRVISRTTALICKRTQKSLPELARELGIDGVVEGSVLRSDGRVRISAQLIHAPSDTHLWADSYDRDLRDILALQAEVATAIVNEIQVKVTAQELRQLAHAPVVDPEAYDAYLRGRAYWDKRSPAAIRTAIESFEQAIARDPNFAAAHAGLAGCMGSLGWWGYAPPDASCAKAKALASRALEMDTGLAEGHTALAWAVQYYDYDFVTAEREFRRAIALDPHYPVAHHQLALTLALMGRFDESIAEAKHAVALDPTSTVGSAALSYVAWLARRYDLLFENASRNVELHPTFPASHWALGTCYTDMARFDAAIAEMRLAVETSGGATIFSALLAETLATAGHKDDARQMLEQLLKQSVRQYVSPYMVARVHAALGESDVAFRWLETAYRERAAWLATLKVDPHVDSLRSDPRFDDLLGRMNIPSATASQP